MAKSAAIAPLTVMPMSNVRVMAQIVAMAPIKPAAAARVVTTTKTENRPQTAPSVDPGLKPNQPNHRIRTASPTYGIECPGITLGRLSRPEYLPWRGPSRSRAAKAPVAPIRWTTVEPAKSCMPKFADSQPPPKIQCETIGEISDENTTA